MRRFPSKISYSFMIFGIFSVLCQLVFTILHMDHFHPFASPSVLLHTYAHFIEYTLASLALTFGGAWIIDYLLLKESCDE